MLQVSVCFGGCDAFEELTVEEDAESVTLTNRLSCPGGSGEMNCTADLGGESIDVVLEESLGDRSLQGCGSPPPACLEIGDDPSRAGASIPGSVVVGDEVVLVETWDRLAGLGRDDGELRWEHPHGNNNPGYGEPLIAVDDLVLWAARYGLDVTTGEERWRDLPTPNAPLVEVAGQVHVIDENSGEAQRLDPQTGALSPSPLTIPYGTTVLDDLLVSVDGTGVATAVDASSGQERWSTPLGQLSPHPDATRT